MSMNLNRLLVIAILVPSVFVVVVLVASFVPHQTGLLNHQEEHIGIAIGMVAGIVPFAFFMLRIFRRIEAHIFQQNDTLSRRNTEMEALLELSRAVETSLDLDNILSASLKVVLTTTSAEATEVWLLDDKRKVLTLRHHQGAASEAFFSIMEFQLGHGYPGIVAQSGKAIFAHDLPSDDRFLRQSVKDAGFQTFFALPLKQGGKISGVLSVAARDAEALTSPDELRLLELMAERIAAALENARLHQEVETLAILTERERLAREMHDGLGQVLGYVNTKAQAVKELLKAGQSDEAILQMGQLEAAAQETYEDVREAILALRTNGRKRPLLESLKEYIDRFSDFSGVNTELTVKGDPVQFNPAVEVQLLRIVQEALANARKHANARHIVVELSFERDVCHLRVEDDGQGFDPDHVSRGPWPHLGIQSMHERAAAINAEFVLDTKLGRGTKILVDIPG